MKTILTVLLFLGFLHQGISQHKTFPPKNEVNSDTSLALFVQHLQNALINKDAGWIKSVLDDEVASTFDEENNIASFVTNWDLENDSSSFWPSALKVVQLGGVFLHDEGDDTGKYQFAFPYTYALDLDEEDDYFDLGVITGKNVNLRESPDVTSKVVTQLSYDVIYYVTDDEDPDSDPDNGSSVENEWYHITTYDKKQEGWVNSKYVYSLMGPRLFLYKNDKGQWKIAAFLSGD